MDLTHPETWRRHAARIIRVELARKDINYKQLAAMLKALDVETTNLDISAKLRRGTFPAEFLLQVLFVLGVSHIEVTPPEANKTCLDAVC